METSNTWDGDGTANTAVLQGMYDYLRSHGVAKVGLYSTGYQWQKITGGYTAGSADRYRAAGAPHGPPTSPPTSPARRAAVDRHGRFAQQDQTRTLCETSFTGAPTQMVQTEKDGFDTNVVCAT